MIILHCQSCKATLVESKNKNRAANEHIRSIPFKPLQLVSVIFSFSLMFQPSGYNLLIGGAGDVIHMVNLTGTRKYWGAHNVVQRGFLGATSDCYEMRLINFHKTRKSERRGTSNLAKFTSFTAYSLRICFQNDIAKVCIQSSLHNIYIYTHYIFIN